MSLSASEALRPALEDLLRATVLIEAGAAGPDGPGGDGGRGGRGGRGGFGATCVRPDGGVDFLGEGMEGASGSDGMSGPSGPDGPAGSPGWVELGAGR